MPVQYTQPVLLAQLKSGISESPTRISDLSDSSDEDDEGNENSGTDTQICQDSLILRMERYITETE